MTHEELRELIPSHALDALAPEEVPGLEAHLTSCENCRRELAEMRETAAALASGFPRAEPPAEMRWRILDAMRLRQSEARRGRFGGLAFAGAAVIILLLGGGASLALYQSLATLKARLAAQAQVLVLIASPSARTVVLTGTESANVRFVFDPDREQGALVAANLQDPGPEFVYQVWLVAGGAPESVGVFRPVRGQLSVLSVGANFRNYQAVAISVEHAPSGASRPTTAPILIGKI